MNVKNKIWTRALVVALSLFLLSNLGGGFPSRAEGDGGSPTVVAARGTPSIDGLSGDAAWGSPTNVALTPVFPGMTGVSQATLQAAYDTKNVYFLLSWQDPTGTESIHKKAWDYKAGTWKQRKEDEDRAYFVWNINASDWETAEICTYAHIDDPNWPADIETKMGTNFPQDRVDVWHWKATRSNPVGYAEDKYWVDATGATVLSYEGGQVRRTRLPDRGTGFAASNKDTDTGLPTYMHRDDPGANVSVLLVSEAVPFDPNAGWKEGDTIPGYVLRGGTGGIADVLASGKYVDGRWTVEFQRQLNSGDPDDTVFQPNGSQRKFLLGVTDNAGATKTAAVVRLTFE